MNLPEELLLFPPFARYFRTWERNRASIVFVPLAEICRQRGFLQEALEICQEGLHYLPDSISGRLTLTKIQIDLGHRDEALSLLEAILRDFPGHEEALALVQKLAPERALQQPISPWETCTMAQILIDQGERAAALKILGKILQARPDDLRAFKLKEEICRSKS